MLTLKNEYQKNSHSNPIQNRNEKQIFQSNKEFQFKTKTQPTHGERRRKGIFRKMKSLVNEENLHNRSAQELYSLKEKENHHKTEDFKKQMFSPKILLYNLVCFMK